MRTESDGPLDSKRILAEAVEIMLNPEESSDEVLVLTLDRRLAVGLCSTATLDQGMEQAHIEVFGSHDTDGITHEESMASILGKKITDILGDDVNKPMAEIDKSEKVAIPLSKRELNFLNHKLRESIQSPLSDIRPTDDERAKDARAWYNDISFGVSTRAMQAYRSLNLAWVEAGGTADPDFTRFHEGSNLS